MRKVKGRPPLPETAKRKMFSLRLSPSTIEWLKKQPVPATRIIEEALIEKIKMSAMSNEKK